MQPRSAWSRLAVLLLAPATLSACGGPELPPFARPAPYDAGRDAGDASARADAGPADDDDAGAAP